jgi:hypothetical protein
MRHEDQNKTIYCFNIKPTVARQLVEEAGLVGLGALVPRLLLGRGHFAVHGGRVLGKLAVTEWEKNK